MSRQRPTSSCYCRVKVERVRKPWPGIFIAAARARTSPLVCLNCAAIAKGSSEATLFGNEQGTLSGAEDSTQGYLQAADGGTIFLDEISELDIAVQGRLLRFLESGEVQPVGTASSYKLNVRVIVATSEGPGRER